MEDSLKAIEQYRRPHPLKYPHKKGDCFGWFEIPRNGDIFYVMVAPLTSAWQHVSVSRSKTCPTWEDMQYFKDLILGPDCVAVQYHVRAKDHINLAKTCLHLWVHKDIPVPPKGCV